jgi:hypothetical protein
MNRIIAGGATVVQTMAAELRQSAKNQIIPSAPFAAQNPAHHLYRPRQRA